MVATLIVPALAAAFTSATGILIPYGAFQALTVVGSLALVGGTVALASAAARAQRPSGAGAGSQPNQVNSPEVRGSIKQDTPGQKILIGEQRVGGAVYFYEVKPPYLYLGLVHSVLPITSVQKVFVGETELTFGGIDDGVISAPFPVAGQPAYNARLQVCVQFGSSLAQGVNPIIAADFPEKGPNCRLPGIANSVWRFDYGANFDEFQALWGQVQIPNVQIVARGCPLPDPREPTHQLDFDPRDPASLYAAMATWKYSDNASLAAAFYALMPFGLAAGPAAIDWESVKAAAAFDGEMVPLKAGGAQRRHTVDGVISLDGKPLTDIEGMQLANGGFMSVRRGKIHVSSSQPRDPVITLCDSDIIAGFTYRDRAPKRELVNTPRAVFVAPDANYSEAETRWPAQSAIDAMVAADGEIYEQTLRLGFVLTHQRVQRRLKTFLSEQRLGRALNVVCGLRLLGAVEGEVVRVSLAEFPAADGLYQVESWSLTEDFSGLVLALTEYDSGAARDWNAQIDELPFVPVI